MSNLVFILNKDNSDNYLDWINLKSSKYKVIFIEEENKNKWKTVSDLLSNYRFKLFRNDFPCFINSDINSTDKDLCEFLDVFENKNLNFASPSIEGSEDFFSSKNCFLRNVNYVPNVFFAFSKNAISLFRKKKVLSFNESGSGIDWALPSILKNEGVAILDSVKINYNFEQQEKKIKDFVDVYTTFNLESFYYTEFSRVENKEEIDVESFTNSFEKLNSADFNRPHRRQNGCVPIKSYLVSQRLMNASGSAPLR